MLAKKAIEKAINKKELEIRPFRRCQLNPNSYDVRLGDKIAYYSLTELDEMKVVYGQVDMFHTPRDFGHTAALDHVDPYTDHVVQQTIFDLVHENATIQEEIPKTGFILYPGVLYLAYIEEEVYSPFYVPEIGGKSSLARAGITIHETSGYANLGDRCRFVIEITAKYPTIIYPHMRIGQIVFHESSESRFWNRFLVKHHFRKASNYNGRYAGKQSIGEENEIIPRYVPSKEMQLYFEKVKEEFPDEESEVVQELDGLQAVDDGLSIDMDHVDLATETVVESAESTQEEPAEES